MAKQEHLDILMQGIEQWNAWREAHTEIRPELSGAMLLHADLRRANLTRTNLSRAILNRALLLYANLRDADLHDANLSSAYLIGTDLSKVDLSRADLRGAILSICDLSDARLKGADFSGAIARNANFYGSDLTEAVLCRTYLNGANLSGTKLHNTDLSDADLSEANFSRADLSGANLSRTSLIGVIFNWTSLDSVNLSGASLLRTTFSSVNLSTAKGLDTVKHNGPSTLGIDTIFRSKGAIPEIFLQRAGVPDTVIEYTWSLISRPIDYYTCFISYSSKDQAFAERLHADLQSKGVRCYFAPEHMKIGDKIRSRIDESIRLYDKLLLVLSEHSVKSQWVETEVETAFEKERQQEKDVLFPIRLDDTVMQTSQAWAADIRRTRHIGDFTRWKDHDKYQAAFTRLLRDLKAEYQKQE